MCKIISGGEFDVAKRTVTSTKLSEGDEIVSVVVLILCIFNQSTAFLGIFFLNDIQLLNNYLCHSITAVENKNA